MTSLSLSSPPRSRPPPLPSRLKDFNVTRAKEEAEVQGWMDPRVNGGRLLDIVSDEYGEPLNVIISAKSDPFILNLEGLKIYSKSLGFSSECLGLHSGHIHKANLGDGVPDKDEEYLSRENYFPVWGTCWESLAGGNHFRAWQQNGTLSQTGAWFLGCSKEDTARKNHMILPNGYNIGRDFLVAHAIQITRWGGKWWQADLEWNEDLLEAGKDGVNHGIEQDGRVAILTVRRL